MRSRRLALPPRCGSKWSARCSNALTAVSGMSYLLYLCSTGPPHDGTRQDQVGWSEGGPHIVIRQYTFVDGAWAREGSRPMAGPSISRTKIIIFFAPQ